MEVRLAAGCQRPRTRFGSANGFPFSATGWLFPVRRLAAGGRASHARLRMVVSDDGHRVHLYERYVDSAGALAHLATFQQRYMTRFFDILQPERIVLYGSPNQAVRDTFAQLEGVTMAQAAGFSRRGGTDGSLPPARVRLPDDAARPSQPT
jgi:hypothetical protein